MTVNHGAQKLPGAEPGAEVVSPGLSADIMAAEVSRLMATPVVPEQSVVALRRTDSAFDVLDGLLRSGAPLPLHWRVNGDAKRREPVTALYDSVSEALREVGGAAQSFAALRSACALWRRLDAELRSGSPLPEPWQRRR
ncbi:hypothetical protein [Nocardiopsis exhalans]